MTSLSIVESKLPPGFRFHPKDDELICDYLMKKKDNSNNNSRIKSETPAAAAATTDYCSSELDSSSTSSTSPSSSQLLIEVDLNKCEPWDIPKQACVGGKDFYFYSQRDRKYATGLRTNRATVSGYWKATGKDRPIARKGHLVGMRKTLVFYQGRAPKGKKTNWVMHEFRIEGPHGPPPLSASSKEDWVLCRVFRKSGEGSNNKQSQDRGGDDEDDDHEQLINITHHHCHSVDDESTASPASTLPGLMDSYIPFDHHRRRKLTTDTNHSTATTDHQYNNSMFNNNNNSSIHAYEQVPCFSSNIMFSLNHQPNNTLYSPTAYPHHHNIYTNTTDSMINNMISSTTTTGGGINPIISFGGYGNGNNNHGYGSSLMTQQDGIMAPPPHSASSTSNATASDEMNCSGGTYVFDHGATTADQLSACDKHVIKAVLSQLTKNNGNGGGSSNLMLGKDGSPVVSLGEAAAATSSNQSYLSDVGLGLHNPTTVVTTTTPTIWSSHY